MLKENEPDLNDLMVSAEEALNAKTGTDTGLIIIRVNDENTSVSMAASVNHLKCAVGALDNIINEKQSKKGVPSFSEFLDLMGLDSPIGKEVKTNSNHDEVMSKMQLLMMLAMMKQKGNKEDGNKTDKTED